MAKSNESYVKFHPEWGMSPMPDSLEPMTTYEMFHKIVEKSPDKLCIVFMGKELSYADLDELVKSYAASLLEMGVQKGDRIGSMLPNCPQQVIAFLATSHIGAIHVPVNVMNTPDELLYIFNDAGVKMIVTLDLFYPTVIKIKDQLSLKKIIVTGIDDFLPFPINLLYRLKTRVEGTRVKVAYTSDIVPFKQMIKKKVASIERYSGFDFEDTMLLIYTAGTTGKSKGVMLTHHNFIYNAANACCNLGVKEDDINLVLFPMFHITGYIIGPVYMFYAGGVTILEPRFDAERYLMLMDKYQVTLFLGAPTVFVAFMNSPNYEKYDISSLRLCVAAGAPVPKELQKRWKAATGLDLGNAYGLTETTSPATFSTFKKMNPDSLGVPMGCDVKIVDEKEKIVPIGSEGEIIIKGDNVAKGYWNKPDDTAKTFVEGWLHTGDIGYADDDGFIHFVDREKDIIIASAYNISPTEVEGVLLKHEAVNEVGVIGVPDEYRGETVKAFIILNEAYTGKITEEDIINWSKEQMAAYKYPRIIEFVEDLPKSQLQKVLRKELRKMEEAKAKTT